MVMDTSSAEFLAKVKEAVVTYDKYIICLNKTQDEFLRTVLRLAAKAKKAFEERDKLSKNGIALDKYVTVIFSENPKDGESPVCNIYFNLSSDYAKKLKTK